MVNPTMSGLKNGLNGLFQFQRKCNPITDLTGRYCCEGQKSPVWFLAGTFGNSVRRKCSIPHHSAIFFPIIEKECSFAEERRPADNRISASR